MSFNEFQIKNPKHGESADAALHDKFLNNPEASLFASCAAVEQALKLGISWEDAIRVMIPVSALPFIELDWEVRLL